MSYKIRQFLEHNYKSIYLNGKTLRLALDSSKEITELEYPEFYDVKVTNKCYGGCSWCYQNSVEEPHYENILEKFNAFFGQMSENQRPFQIAYGGGEPTSHPQFLELLKKSHELGITPNYTTNGMHMDQALIDYTKKYCGGVAISCHPHLLKYWSAAANLFLENDIIVNFHVIISDKDSIDDFKEIYMDWKDEVEYFVLLPLIAQGRAEKNAKVLDEDYFTKVLLELKEMYKEEESGFSDIAFGANFYKYLLKNEDIVKLDLSLYEPEIMSKYLSFEENGKLHPSSFSVDNVIDEDFFIEDSTKHEKILLRKHVKRTHRVYNG